MVLSRDRKQTEKTEKSMAGKYNYNPDENNLISDEHNHIYEKFKNQETQNDIAFGAAAGYSREAAENGSPYSQLMLGIAYETGKGVEEDHEQAMYWFQKAAEQGLADAQLLLGVTYIDGENEEINLEKGAYWIEKAAAQGNRDAQRYTGYLYLNGKGVEKNPVNAVYWYQKAAEQGDPGAQCTLARIYSKDSGIGVDSEKAVYWARKAADQDYADGQNLLATFYFIGYGVEKDLAKSYELHKKAAEQGDAQAMGSLSLCYSIGSGVEKNLEKALYWAEKAAAGGNELARDRLDDLRKEVEEEKKGIKHSSEKTAYAGSHYVDWFDVLLQIGAIAAAFIFLRGTPLYNWSIEHRKEINFLLKPVVQLAAIAMSTLGAGAALALLFSFSEGLILVGGIAGAIGGLITIFCYEDPAVYQIAQKAAMIVAGLAVLRIIIALLSYLRKR